MNNQRESYSQFYNNTGGENKDNDHPAYEPQMETERDLGSSQEDQDEQERNDEPIIGSNNDTEEEKIRDNIASRIIYQTYDMTRPSTQGNKYVGKRASGQPA